MPTANSRTSLDVVAMAGLAAGAVFGIAGTLVSQASLRQVFWAIDGVGLIVATTLLALRFFRRGDDGVAAGFLVFAMREPLVPTAAPLPFLAYPVLVLTFVGWIATLLKRRVRSMSQARRRPCDWSVDGPLVSP